MLLWILDLYLRANWTEAHVKAFGVFECWGKAMCAFFSGMPPLIIFRSLTTLVGEFLITSLSVPLALGVTFVMYANSHNIHHGQHPHFH